jgi:hypothetical protein
MAGTKDKVQKVLSEVRNLVLGAQILLGFTYEAVFRPGFDKLPSPAKTLQAVSLALLLVAVACLIAPSSFHRIVERGESTRRQLAYAKLMVGVALLPFGLALGLNLFVSTESFLGPPVAAVTGSLGSAVAFAFWYGIPLMQRRDDRSSKPESDEQVPLKEKINELLTESRIVLPGAQALLGFQLGAYLTEGFEKLPQASKLVHTGSLLCIALAMVLLMAPAPFHRIAENGENTERFDKVGVALILAALVPLALGLAGDLYVVLAKISGRAAFAAGGAAAAVIGAYALWFGVPLAARSRRAGPPLSHQGR